MAHLALKSYQVANETVVCCLVEAQVHSTVVNFQFSKEEAHKILKGEPSGKEELIKEMKQFKKSNSGKWNKEILKEVLKFEERIVFFKYRVFGEGNKSLPQASFFDIIE